MKNMSTIVALALLAGPAIAQPQPAPSPPMIVLPSPRGPAPFCVSGGCMNPVEAVTYASYLAPKGGVAGDFEMQVQAVGTQNGMVYLNSEKDYRDRNCLTIAMPLILAKGLFRAEDISGIETKLKGKRITVRGIARQVRINFLADGKPTGKYYFQVHVGVTSPTQIHVDDRG